MQAIEQKILSRVYGRGRGWAFTKIDFVADFGEVNILVNSGISAPPSVPQLIITDKTTHKLASSAPTVVAGPTRK